MCFVFSSAVSTPNNYFPVPLSYPFPHDSDNKGCVCLQFGSQNIIYNIYSHVCMPHPFPPWSDNEGCVLSTVQQSAHIHPNNCSLFLCLIRFLHGSDNEGCVCLQFSSQHAYNNYSPVPMPHPFPPWSDNKGCVCLQFSSQHL